jgi:hypothetical protein
VQDLLFIEILQIMDVFFCTAAVVLALRDIAPGEEITICYVDQEATLEERKIALRDYGFECDCERCVAEALAAELTT